MKTILIVIGSFIVGLVVGHFTSIDKDVYIAQEYKAMFKSQEVTVAGLDETSVRNSLKEFDPEIRIYRLAKVTLSSPTNVVSEYIVRVGFGDIFVNGTLNERGEWTKGSYENRITHECRRFTSASLKSDPNIPTDLRQIMNDLAEQTKESKTVKQVKI